MEFLKNLFNSPGAMIAIWVALAVLVVALILAFRPRRILLAADKGGRLHITQRALHRLIEACCMQLEGVASARARVRGRLGKFETRIRLKVRPDARLDAIQGYLKQEIADIYRQNLGIANEGEVVVEVTGVER